MKTPTKIIEPQNTSIVWFIFSACAFVLAIITLTIAIIIASISVVMIVGTFKHNYDMYAEGMYEYNNAYLIHQSFMTETKNNEIFRNLDPEDLHLILSSNFRLRNDNLITGRKMSRRINPKVFPYHFFKPFGFLCSYFTQYCTTPLYNNATLYDLNDSFISILLDSNISCKQEKSTFYIYGKINDHEFVIESAHPFICERSAMSKTYAEYN